MTLFNIRDFGACGDGRTPATMAFQEALAAIKKAGGGQLHVPPGTYRCGTLELVDNLVLDLAPGAVLLASPDLADYPEYTGGHNKDRQPYHFLLADGLRNVVLRGGGCLDGNGPAFWHPQPTPPFGWYREKSTRPSPMLEIRGCRDVRMEGITIRNSPGWTVHLHDCDNVRVIDVDLLNDLFGPNTDGLDINGSHDVVIRGCRIRCGDDAVVLKTTPDSRTCERITVSNCIIETNCVGLKLGANESYQDMQHILFTDCVVHRSHRMIGFYGWHGAVYRDIIVSNITGDTLGPLPLTRPLHIDLRQEDDQAPPSRLENLFISNLIARTRGRILMTSEDGCVARNVRLEHVQLVMEAPLEDPEEQEPTSRSRQFSNHSPQARRARAAIVATNLTNLSLRKVAIDWPETPAAVPFHTLWGRGLNGLQYDPEALTGYGGATPGNGIESL